MKKKLLLTAVIMILVCIMSICVNAATYGNLTYSISNGEVTITDCSTSATNVTIPSTINGYPVTSIGSGAFSECSSLTSITIPDSVTSIGDYAFYFCTSLTSITVGSKNRNYSSNEQGVLLSKDKTNLILYPMGKKATVYEIPDNVTSIGGSAFRSCTGLTSITIPDSVTSIGDYAFSDCTGLTSVTIGNSVTSIGVRAFNNCTCLTSVTIGDSVTSMGYEAFRNCTSLTQINWNAKNVVDFNSSNHVFYYAGKNGVGINVVFGDRVEKIPVYAFCPDSSSSSYAPKIISVTIGDNVTSIGSSAFFSCTSLASVTIGDSVTSIGNDAFYKCTGLTSITIPDSVTSIGYAAFSDCISLTSVTIGNSVTSIVDNAFYNCTGLTQINWNAKNVADFRESNCVFANAGKNGDGINVVFADSVEKIPAYAFCPYSSSSYFAPKIISVTIGDSVTSIGDYAFYNCTGLTQINWNAKNVADFESSNYVFAYAGQNGDGINVVFGDSVEIIPAYAFCPKYSSDVPKIISVTIGNSVTIIRSYAFSRCTGLTTVTIPDSVTLIDSGAFYNCSATKYYEGSTTKWSKVKNPSNYTVSCKYDSDNIRMKGVPEAQAGEDVTYGVYFFSSYKNDYLISTIKYPKTFTLKEIINKDFVDNSIDTQTSDSEYNYITVISTYSFEGERTEQYTGYTPYEIVFTVSETCPIGTYNLSFVDETISLGDDDYTLLLDSVDVFVTDTLTIYGDNSISAATKYTVTGKNSPDVPVKWSVDDETVATISEDGVLTPIDSGTVTITATYTENATVFATKTVTIQSSDVTDIDIIGSTTVYDGEKYSVKFYPENLNYKSVKWSVDNTEIATITEDGILTALAAGEVTLRATVQDAKAYYEEITVTIPSCNAVIDTLSSDIGIWDKDFSSYIRHYTVIVPSDITAISLTGSFTGGSLKCGTTTMLNGRARSITLDDDVTILTLTRSNVSGKNNSSYTIVVVKEGTAPVKAGYSVTAEEYSFAVNVSELPETAENPSVILALYDTDGRMIDVIIQNISSDNKNAYFSIEKNEDFYSYNIMVYENLSKLKCIFENINGNIE